MRQKITELTLLSQCALADNRQAFGRLVEMHQAKVRRFLLNLTRGDAALTDDLAQETFLKAWITVRSFQGLSNFTTWLYRIAYNEYLAHLRRRREDSLPAGFDAISEPGEADDRRPTLLEEIERLTEPTRTIVLLFYSEDRSVKEISRIMDLPLGTVKVYLTRGRETLKKKFQK